MTQSHTEKLCMYEKCHYTYLKKKTPTTTTKKKHIYRRLNLKGIQSCFITIWHQSFLHCFRTFSHQMISDFRVFAFASRSVSSSLCNSIYLSRWISVCVSPRLSSWWVDSWATWGKVFNSFSQVSSSRLGTTNHTLYREPVLLFPDMFTTPPWTYIQPAWRRMICATVSKPT